MEVSFSGASVTLLSEGSAKHLASGVPFLLVRFLWARKENEHLYT